MKALVITMAIMNLFSGSPERITYVENPNQEIKCEVINAYYTDGEKITELSVSIGEAD